MSTTISLSLAHRILFLNTLAFTVCFACCTLNGVLVTFLVDNGIFKWDVVQVGWILGILILTESIMSFPIGMLNDKFGDMIEMIGGLGGFISLNIFSYLLTAT